MKKLLTIFFISIMLVGCSFINTPTGRVESYLDKYNNHDEDIMLQLDNYIGTANYNETQKAKYKDIVKSLYKDMKYEIVNETIDGNTATVEVEVQVYDMYLINKNSQEYLANNADEFFTNGEYDENIYFDYLLKEMEKNKTTVKHKIIFSLTKTDGQWVIDDLSDDNIAKLHGTYAY